MSSVKLDKNRAVKNQTTSTPSGTNAAKSMTSVSFFPVLAVLILYSFCPILSYSKKSNAIASGGALPIALCPRDCLLQVRSALSPTAGGYAIARKT